MKSYKIRPDISQFIGRSCFICRSRLTASDGPRRRTLEHLIPQWIIKQFGLIDATVTMGSLGEIRYMDYLLPCCAECNSHLLAPVERAISRALKEDSPRQIDEKRLAQWAAKIILGVQLYERAERHDKSKPSNGEQLIRDYLASLRGAVEISHYNQFDYPISLFWFRTKTRTDSRRNFDFQVSPYLQSIYLRLGGWSFLARADAGYIRRNGSHVFFEYQNAELAPIQVEELAAHFFTMAELSKSDHLVSRKRLPSGRTLVTRYELQRREPFGPISDDVNEFLTWFSYFTGAEQHELMHGKNQRLTYLKDEMGKFMDCPADFGWH